MIFHNGAVCVLAVTDEQKLIFQAVPQSYIEAVSYDIPGKIGSRRKYTAPVACPIRELEEETAYTKIRELVHDFFSYIGFCNEKLKLYLASDLTKVENPRPQDEDELGSP